MWSLGPWRQANLLDMLGLASSKIWWVGPLVHTKTTSVMICTFNFVWNSPSSLLDHQNALYITLKKGISTIQNFFHSKVIKKSCIKQWCILYIMCLIYTAGHLRLKIAFNIWDNFKPFLNDVENSISFNFSY